MTNATNKTAEQKAVAVKEEAGLPAVVNFEQDSGAGLNNLSAQDYAIPFISILQQLSPQLKRGDAKNIEGAKEGFIFNTVTEEIIDGDKGISVVPCGYQKKWVEWKPRHSGGGLVMQHDTDALEASCTRDDKGNLILPSGNILVPTAYYYIMILKEGGITEKAIISMTSTQLKKAKKWNSVMGAIKMKRGDGSLYTPAMFSHSYRLETVREEKNTFSWYGWDISTEGPLTNASIYAEARKLNQEVEKGGVKAQPVETEHAVPETTSEVM